MCVRARVSVFEFDCAWVLACIRACVLVRANV